MAGRWWSAGRARAAAVLGGGGDRADAGHRHERPPDLRDRRQPARGPGRVAAQGRLGLVPRELLRRHPARGAGAFPATYVTSFHLPAEQSGAHGSAGEALSQPAGDRRGGGAGAGPAHHGSGGQGGGVRVPVRPAGRRWWCCSRRSARPTTSACSTPRSCARSAPPGGRCWRLNVAEFAAIGALAGLLAAIGATVLGYRARHPGAERRLQHRPGVWLVGLVGGTAGVLLAGLLGTRRVLRTPPMTIFREAG